MATLIDANKVKYLCSCKRLKPLSYLYYCKYCKPFTLKCKDCVIHEIDQKFFCANCFDNKVQKEVMSVKYKCASCFNCPVCKNLLLIRASSIKPPKDGVQSPLAVSQSSPALVTQTPNASSSNPATPQQSPQAPQQGQKVFYLICVFCRWTTRDVGIPDVTSAPGGWKLQENPHVKRIQELTEGYKVIAAREKLEKDRKKYPNLKRRSLYISGSSSSSSILHADKYGILAPVQKRLAATASIGNQNLDPQITMEQQFRSLVKPAQTVDSFEELPEDFFANPPNINSITSINQRHANPDFQPSKASELYPLNKFYQSKESKRCSGCEHNVLKPESNVISIKFKLHQMALFLVPEVRIMTIPKWTLNEENEVILSITNRYESDVTVSFVNIDNENVLNLSGFKPTAKIEFKTRDDLSIVIDRQDNSKVQQAQLKQSDLETNGFLCFRRDNKIAVKCTVTPFLSNTEIKDHVKCVFGLKCSINMPEISSPQVQGSTPTTKENFVNSVITHYVFVDFGPLRLEDGLKVVPTPRFIDDCLKASLNK
ncbi:unnamed protein product [Brachionus calyciflorus]|uniref:Dynactin subunit 4 n=1 Tax=Brachionus calyciflorus TaxID=104777 RepID=A0A813PXX5_9BILA|nr:unnamed protein product [Brachionus calyciflorus]